MLEKLDELDLNRGIESKEKRVLDILFLSIFAELNLHKFFLDYSTGSISKEVSDEISQIKKSQPELFMKETEEELLQEIQMSIFRIFYYLVHKYIPYQTYSPTMVFENLFKMNYASDYLSNGENYSSLIKEAKQFLEINEQNSHFYLQIIEDFSGEWEKQIVNWKLDFENLLENFK